MAKAGTKTEGSRLRLVTDFSVRSYPYKCVIPLNQESRPIAGIDTVNLDAVRFYIHQKIKELDITDYRVFAHDETIDVLFTNTADQEEFESVFEDRHNQPIELQLKTLRRHAAPSLTESIAKELTALAEHFGIGNDVRFETSPRTPGTIRMIAANREAFTTFFQEYDYTKGAARLSLQIDPENLPYLSL